MIYYVIYRITNLINGRYYTGKHKTNDLEDGYFGSPGKTSDFLKDLKKYGKESFKKEYLFFAIDDKQMNSIEEKFVELNSLSYNKQRGGKGGNPPIGARFRSGKANSMYGKDPWNKGRIGLNITLTEKDKERRKQQMRAFNIKGTKWINDGNGNRKKILKEKEIPFGWKSGMK
jgi:hypothetical protein